jgi:hypothetical protein
LLVNCSEREDQSKEANFSRPDSIYGQPHRLTLTCVFLDTFCRQLAVL